MKWSENQEKIIAHRDHNLLVSAAAGSGKTAVLVERIITMITDPVKPVDIDRLLIVTFTRAAAAEMKERISNAIEKRLDENPEDAHLQRQSALVGRAKITTIDSFCSFVVKSLFQYSKIEPGFRIADESEMTILSEEVLEEVLESLYEEGDPSFLEFADNYQNARSNRNIKEMIYATYKKAQSFPWPKKWLDSLADYYNPDKELLDKWNDILLTRAKEELEPAIDYAKEALSICRKPYGPVKYENTVKVELAEYESFMAATRYDDFMRAVKAMTFSTIPTIKAGTIGVDDELRERAKSLRDSAKSIITKKLQSQSGFESLEQAAADLREIIPAVLGLTEATKRYMELLFEKKLEKNVFDFDDISHNALNILLDEETENPTDAARSLSTAFDEVIIDEYQDSSPVQEKLLFAITGAFGRKNRFMVGDVKQSIYRFRQAKAELFMEKYDSFTGEAGPDDKGKKIILDKNFRSRAEVLDSVNDIFSMIMRKDFGGIEYDDENALHVGADYPAEPTDCFKTEVLLVPGDLEAAEEAGAETKRGVEARLIALKIKELMDNHKVSVRADDGTYTFRPLKYSDIAILLRAADSWADEFAEAFKNAGIPSHQEKKAGFFKTPEVQHVLDILSVIDNPYNDIPLAGMLKGTPFFFTDDELSRIAVHSGGSARKGFFFTALLNYAKDGKEAFLAEKCASFIDTLNELRDKALSLRVPDLLTELYDTLSIMEYAHAMPGGDVRRANLESLIEKAYDFEDISFKGLFTFIKYINNLKDNDKDAAEQELLGENDDVVRIMTIHKSKGLEFPVVFLANTAKSHNLKDASGTLIVDDDFGVGLIKKDRKNHIKKETLLRQIQKINIKDASIAEEMRVLYVALTRAREKLIITATVKDPQGAVEKYEKGASLTPTRAARRGGQSYLDWIMPSCILHPDHFKLKVYTDEDFKAYDLNDAIDKSIDLVSMEVLLNHADPDVYESIDRKLSFIYPFSGMADLKRKVSVSELKHRDMVFPDEDGEKPEWYAASEIGEEKPAKTGDIYKGALYGTSMHRFLECFDYKSWSASAKDKAEIERQILSLKESGKIDDETAELLNVYKLSKFFDSSAASRMEHSDADGLLHREQTFMMGVPATEVYNDAPSDETVLIQGIIDVYFEEDGELVLLDYKTDKVSSEKELTDRYKTQLDLYKKALSRATGMNVKEVLIYSFALDKEIII
ncbi:MAG: helicase-exonuclease AddAB subunit AddA [Lachnospiraceae bacterium]|nr:helicase-exonuclease AddAB subunit AddA [Lachnospiraceae bacterium]